MGVGERGGEIRAHREEMPLPGATHWAVAAGIQLSCSQAHFICGVFPKETMVEGPWRTPRPPRIDRGSRVTMLAQSLETDLQWRPQVF